MRIFFNRLPVAGPWGGGSKVLSAIMSECQKRGHVVTNGFDRKVDLIFCMDPRPDANSNYNILLQLRERDKSPIVQRVGDLGTHGKPELYDLVKATEAYSNYFVFPSYWAYRYSDFAKEKCAIIENAPLSEFVTKEKRPNIESPISLVTHHWSNNPLKGFDFYLELDAYCKNRDDIDFTYIGRKPDDVTFANSLDPMDIEGLVKNIGNKDIYVTASKKEAGANHVLEAMALGLPVLYHEEGGSIPEYCKERGFSFSNLENFLEILESSKKIKEMSNFSPYERDSFDMAAEYVDLFERAHENKY